MISGTTRWLVSQVACEAKRPMLLGNKMLFPLPAPANWQEMFAAMEAQLRETQAELRAVRQQAVPQVPEVEIRQAEVHVHAPAPVVREGRIEPLYEQFKK